MLDEVLGGFRGRKRRFLPRVHKDSVYEYGSVRPVAA